MSCCSLITLTQDIQKAQLRANETATSAREAEQRAVAAKDGLERLLKERAREAEDYEAKLKQADATREALEKRLAESRLASEVRICMRSHSASNLYLSTRHPIGRSKPKSWICRIDIRA